MKRIPLVIQLSLILFLVLIVPCVLLNTYSSHVVTQSSNHEIAEATLRNIEAGRRLTETVSDSVSSSIHRLAADYDFSGLQQISRYASIRYNVDNGIRVNRLQQELGALARNEPKILSAFFLPDGADYVISSDRGVVELDGYLSVNWLQTVSQEKRGLGGVWIPRRMSNATIRGMQTGSSPDTSVDVVSYVYSLNRLITSTYGTLVVNVREREFYQNLNPDPIDDSRYGTMLLQKNGKMISHPDPANFLIQARNLTGISPILDREENRGYDYLEVNGRQFLYTYLKTDRHDWVYVTIQPMDEMIARTDAVMRGVTVFTVLTVMVCTVIAVMASFYISRPIRNLMKSLRASGDLKKAYSKNELTFLYNAFQQIQEEEKNLNQLLHQHEKDVLALALRNLMAGEPPRSDTEELLRETYPHPLFLVVLIAVDNYARYRDDTNSELRRYRNLLVITRCEEILRPVWPACGISQPEGRVGLIINLPTAEEGESGSPSLERALEKIQQAAEEIFDKTVTIGVSRVVAGFDGISAGAMMAGEAVMRRIKVGSGRVIFWKWEQAGHKYFYPQNTESRILNYLDMGDLELLNNELTTLRKSMSETEEITYDNIRYIYSQLIGATIRHLYENNVNSAYFFIGRGNVYAAIASFDTLDDIQSYLEDFYRDIVEYQKSEVLEEKQYLSQVMNYIEEHFQEDIDFENMAVSIGISYSHMRRVVRDATGKGLLEHLNQRRIQQAKRLLIETDEGMASIAQAVGFHNVQSLNRFFRKYVGTAPSEFRLGKR